MLLFSDRPDYGFLGNFLGAGDVVPCWNAIGHEYFIMIAKQLVVLFRIFGNTVVEVSFRFGLEFLKY